MKYSKSLIIILLIFSLFIPSINKIHASPDTQILEIDGFSSILEEWTEVGNSPWLDYNDNSNYVYTKTDDNWHEEWTFQDQKVQGTINTVYLSLVLKCEDTARSDTVEIYLWDNGISDWVLLRDHQPVETYWYTLTTTVTFLDNWEELNQTKLKIKFDKAGSPATKFIYISQAWITVDYTPTGPILTQESLESNETQINDLETFFLNITISITPNSETFNRNILTIDPSGLALNITYLNGTGFSELNDVNNYISLDMTNSNKTEISNTHFYLIYILKIHNNITKSGWIDVASYSNESDIGNYDSDTYSDVFFLTLQGIGGGMEQVLFGGYNLVLDDTTTKYNCLHGHSRYWLSFETGVNKIISTDGLIKNLRVKLSGSPGIGTKYTFTLMVNGYPSSLTFDIIGDDTVGYDMIHKVDVMGGDLVSIQCDPDGTPTEVSATWTSVFESDAVYESLIMGGGLEFTNNLYTQYGQVMSGTCIYSIAEYNFREVVPTSGTFKNFYLYSDLYPGDPEDGFKFTLRKDGENQTLTITIMAQNKTGSDLVNSFNVIAGDIVTMRIDPLGSPQPLKAVWGMTFVADINGESIVMGGSAMNLSSSVTQYNYVIGDHALSWVGDEALRYQLGQACILKKLHILLNGFPGAGNKYDFTIRMAGVDSNVIATVSDTDTTGNSAELEDIVTIDQYVDLQVDPEGTPNVADAYWGFVSYIEPPPEEDEEEPPVDYFPMLLAIVMCFSLSIYFLYVKNN